MSSILRALKKLESENPQQDESQSWSGKIDTKKAINERAIRNWRFRKVFSMFFIVVIIVVAAWFVLSKKPSLVRQTVTDFVSLNPDKKGVSMTPLPAKKKVRKIPMPDGRTDTAQRKPPVSVSGSEFAARLPARQTIPPMSDVEESEKPSKEDLRPLTARKPAPPEDMGELRLKLQAIVWSSDPKERMAVINGSILREGESIEGFSIARIDADVVVVREGAAEWKLAFELR